MAKVLAEHPLFSHLDDEEAVMVCGTNLRSSVALSSACPISPVLWMVVKISAAVLAPACQLPFLLYPALDVNGALDSSRGNLPVTGTLWQFERMVPRKLLIKVE